MSEKKNPDFQDVVLEALAELRDYVGEMCLLIKKQTEIMESDEDIVEADYDDDAMGEGHWDGATFVDGMGEEHHVANMEPGNSDY